MEDSQIKMSNEFFRFRCRVGSDFLSENASFKIDFKETQMRHTHAKQGKLEYPENVLGYWSQMCVPWILKLDELLQRDENLCALISEK